MNQGGAWIYMTVTLCCNYLKLMNPSLRMRSGFMCVIIPLHHHTTILNIHKILISPSVLCASQPDDGVCEPEACVVMQMTVDDFSSLIHSYIQVGAATSAAALPYHTVSTSTRY